jgi:nucleotide-binding universal stress UspA family protein
MSTQSTPRLLVAWDGSPAAAAAFPVARLVAQQLGADVEALFVAHDAEEGEERTRALTDETRRMGFRLHLRTGDAADEIVRWTEEPHVMLVALTTHGRRLQRGYRLGSVAEKVVARTSRPVLLVKPEPATAGARSLKRLLVPVDGTPKTAAALQPVTELAAAFGAAIDLLYVASPEQEAPTERGSVTAPRYIDQPQHEWPLWAAEAIDRLATCCAGCPPEVPVRIFLAQGEIGDEIARFATENQTDAIVLVRRSRFQPGRAKVIRSVLSQTSCLVIVVGGEET